MSMVLIQRQVLSSSAASVTFSNIPQNYRTLRLVVSARTNRAAVDDNLRIAYNGSTSSQTRRVLFGTGSFAGSGSDSAILCHANGDSATTNVFGNSEVVIPNYASGASKVSSLDGVSENNGTVAYQVLEAHLWSSTAAVSSIVLTPHQGTLILSNSSFSLYGMI